ncbi:MAG TPA: GNAT family N-acetyltransferase [Ignisphaera aggregans]|uniref:GNAT family N-acetyltransferase n=1 Tax=Ignisphaera aggregans TaxID=334771 RepID=A0A832YY74_9CREN|nr:GNAT family N-acetyltransferase [Ignisphaera aggregans]
MYVITECRASDLELIEDSMGWWHGYYAKACFRANVCKCISLSIDGECVGVGLYYVLNTKPVIGVVYYIAVIPRLRGRGLGKVLLASIEHLMEEERVEMSIATSALDNENAIRLFKSMGYAILEWSELAERLGYDVYELLLKATCGYEDDVVMIKSFKGGRLDKVLTDLVNSRNIRTANRVWYTICYEPWRRIRML